MRYNRFLRLARHLSLQSNQIPDKQHIVVVAAFVGKRLMAWRLNSESEHAEDRALQAVPDATRLVVFRFNRADLSRIDRPSCPCSKCCPKIRGSKVKKVEFMSPLGPAAVKVNDLKPYNGVY